MKTNYPVRTIVPLAMFALCSSLLVLQAAETDKPAAPDTSAAAAAPVKKKTAKVAETAFTTLEEKGWVKLFDGKTLYGWKETDFLGHSTVRVEDGQIVLEVGDDMTGITYTNDMPRANYEVTLEAKRVDGADFFCGLTFPVEKEFCSLICGGWGGGVVGISSIDGGDAANNETTGYRSFENGKWYRLRLRITPGLIEAWIDKDKVVDVKVAGRMLSTRIEVDRSKPFGIATWRTSGAVRDLRYRRLESK